MNYDVLVIGAGPIGCTTAGLLSQLGYSVVLFEEHHSIGKPLQCAGIVSPRIQKLVQFKVPISNSIKGAYVLGPGGQEFHVFSNDDKAVVIDRTEFDRNSMRWAAKKGAELHLGSHVNALRIKENSILAETRSGISLRGRIVIGAEGPRSITARSALLPPFKEMVSGFQIQALGEAREADMVEVYVGERESKGFFSWVIPSGNQMLRIGTGVHLSPRSAIQSLHYLMKESPHRNRFKGIQPLSMQSGGIPLGMRERMYGNRSIVIGDAAGLAKPMSGGGLIPGLISARIAVKVVSHALDQDNCSRSFLSSYQKLLIDKLGREHRRAWKLRKSFMYLSDSEWSHLLSLISKPEILAIMNRKGDIDFPGKIAFEIIRVSPGLLKFALKYLGSSIFTM